MSNKFIGKPIPSGVEKSGVVAWRSPSNIALIKYWGKHGVQLPRNPSLSFSLSNAYTETQVKYSIQKEQRDTARMTFLFEGNKNQAFANRIQKHLDGLVIYFPFLKEVDLEIESQNSFPHSSGIASSASSMSALALCLTDIEYKLSGAEKDEVFLHKASYISRLGSGSASRSVYKDFCVWGATSLDEKYSDEYALELQKVNPVFQNLHDDILIVSSAEKSVSSTAGHNLMVDNPYAEIRYAEAKKKLLSLAEIIEQGDINGFGKIVEEEAMSLHALMMCSDPSYVLMEPASLQVINEIRRFRSETGTPIFFTLDAGPNVHVIYPDNVKDQAQSFVKDSLLQYCENGRHIFDKMGDGPERINYISKT